MLPGLTFPNVKEMSMEDVWYHSDAFNRFRGDSWMREPCRSCPDKEKDYGGCRCQAYMLTGAAENTDPVCSLSPEHKLVTDVVERAQHPQAPQVVVKPLVFRTDKNSKAFIENPQTIV